MLYIKTKACSLFLYLWVKIAGTQPDYSELIERRAKMIEASILKADKWIKLDTCKQAITVLLQAPFEQEAAKEIRYLNNLVAEQEMAIMGGYAATM